MSINIWAVIVTTLIAYVIGALWYSLLFQKQWMEITGSLNKSKEEMKRMQKEVTFLEAYVLAWFIGNVQNISGIDTALLIFAGFVLPTLMSAVIWTGTPKRLMRKQILIQLGCQAVTFAVMGLILGMWK